jgi:uncharacterized oxidoreductase
MLINHTRLTDIATGIMAAAGAPEDKARLVAEHLVEANLKGHDSHGVGMVESYVRSMLRGLVQPQKDVELLADNGAILSFDGGEGLGRVVGMQAMEQGIARAKETGICCVALGNASHLGRIGKFGERCADEGMVSMHYVNVVGHDPLVVAYGGRDRRFGTNPFCCVVPRVDGKHVVLDMATTTVAAGKVRVAFMKGLEVPDHALVNSEGVASNDPSLIFDPGDKPGAMTPLGLHKGYGLMVMCELLGGALGGQWTLQPEHERKGSVINNMLSIIIDPDKVGARECFQDEVSEMLSFIYASEPATGVDSVMIPGDPERKRMAELLETGIDVDQNSWDVMLASGEKAGFGADRIEAILNH